MIAYLLGNIIHKNTDSLIILTNQSVGYKVFATKYFIAETTLSQEIKLYIHTHVKENDISLFGFTTLEELNFFENLINVSGIGPKTALDILNNPIDIIKRAILEKDITTLTKIKGLGKKTAERLVLELKNTLSKEEIVISRGIDENNNYNIENDVIDALISLGYEKYSVSKMLQTVPNDIKNNSEEMIKWFLKNA